MAIREIMVLNETYLPGNISFSDGSVLNLTFDEYVFDNPTARVGLYMVYTVVFLFCFFGNLVVVIVATFHWRMRSVTKFCMGNLAFANLCVSIFCIYQNLSTFLQENWIFGRFMCKMYHFTNSLSHTASILILVVICVERYLSIVHPLRCRQMLTIQRLKLTIAGVWILSGLICSPRLYYITTFEIPIPVEPDGHRDVICAPKQTLYDSRTADMIYFILLFLLPLLIMSVLYTRIGSIIWKSSVALQGTDSVGSGTLTTVTREGESQSVSRQYCMSPMRVPHNSLASELPRRSASECRIDGRDISIISRPSPILPNGTAVSWSCNSISRVKSVNAAGGSSSFDNSGSSGNRIENNNIKKNDHNESPREWNSGGGGGKERSGCLSKCCSSVSSTGKRKNRGNNSKSVCFVDPRALERTLQSPAASNGPAVLRIKDERRGQVLQSRQAAIRMLIVVVITFAVCNFPYHLRKICQYYMSNYRLWSSFNQFITPITFVLMYANCALNPILYAFMSKNFRSSLKQLFRVRLSRSTSNNINPNQRRGGGGRGSF